MNNLISEKICGIYAIEAISGSKISQKYIGQSINIKDRWQNGHIATLKKNKHRNPKLQNYSNKYGLKSLKFILLLKCSKSELKFWEKFFVKCFDSRKNGFNLTDGGDENHSRRKCIMQNILTNEIIETERIKDFAQKYNLNQNTISSVLNGKLNFTGEWFCPLNKWRPKIYILISPKGIEHKFYNIQRFCEENNLTTPNVCHVLNSRRKSCKGWTISNRNFIPLYSRKSYILQDKNGKVVEFNDVNKFCKENELNLKSVRKVLCNYRKSIHGWKKPVNLCQQQIT